MASPPPPDDRRRLGALGEDIATEQLLSRGWEVVARNWRSPERLVRGELDVVAVDPEDRALVFVEVKTRRSGQAYGGPLAAVTPTKQAKLRQLGLSFLRTRAVRASRIRFDVIGIVLADGADASIDHVRGAF